MTKTDNTEALEALDALHSYMMSAVSWSYDDGTQFTAVCTLFDKIRTALTSTVGIPNFLTRGMMDELIPLEDLKHEKIDQYWPEIERIICKNWVNMLTYSAKSSSMDIPEGWQLVPKEPTEENMFLSKKTRDELVKVWLEGLEDYYSKKAMLAAAPVYGKDG